MSEQKLMKHGEFCWNELMTGDTAKAKTFYHKLFGWKTEDMPMQHGGTYTMLSTGDAGVGGMMQIPEDQANNIPPHWMSYVYVDDLDESVKKAEALGATIKMPAREIPDYGCFAIIKDPTGAHIAMWQSLQTN